MAERVLELVSDGGKTDDYVCGCNSAGNCDPTKGTEELEGEEVDVEEDDLGDKDIVTDREGRGEDTLGGRLGIG